MPIEEKEFIPFIGKLKRYHDFKFEMLYAIVEWFIIRIVTTL